MSLLPDNHQVITVVQANATAVVSCLLSWGTEVGTFVRESPGTGGYAAIWPSLGEPCCPSTKGVVIGLQNKWTAFFDNNNLQDIAHSVAWNLTRLLGVASYSFCADDNPTSEQRGSAVFAARSPSAANPIKRFVMVTHDSGWQFTQSGQPFPFERLDLYAAKRKADRLNTEVLKSYASAIGVSFWNPGDFANDFTILYEAPPRAADPTRIIGAFEETMGGKLKAFIPARTAGDNSSAQR